MTDPLGAGHRRQEVGALTFPANAPAGTALAGAGGGLEIGGGDAEH